MRFTAEDAKQDRESRSQLLFVVLGETLGCSVFSEVKRLEA